MEAILSGAMVRVSPYAGEGISPLIAAAMRSAVWLLGTAHATATSRMTANRRIFFIPHLKTLRKSHS